ncbi:MAG: hypothetical protein H0T48_14665 [Gemmatimonadaceae bacterium]|nr:hypothetical protein [Gemmatimonadaceae bacterium]
MIRRLLCASASRQLSLWLLVVTAVFVPSTVRAQDGRVVRPNVTTSGSVVALNGNLDVYGTVRGNATALKGDVIVHRGGRVQGDAISIAGRVRNEGGVVDGRMKTYGRHVKHIRRTPARVIRHDTGRTVGLALGWLLMVSLIGFALLAFGPEKLSIVVNTMQGGIGKSLGSGLIGQIAIVPGAVAVVALLAASLVGILLIPLGLIAFMFLVAGVAMFGFVAVATMTGAAIGGGKNRDDTPNGAMLRAFVTGTGVFLGLWVVTALLSGIPLIGAIVRSFASAVTFIAVTTGFGAVLLSYWRGEFKAARPKGSEV